MQTEAFKEYLHSQPLKDLVVLVGIVGEDDIVGDKIICPFHDDHSPSMHLYDESAYCFSCQKRADIIELTEQKFGFSFLEALKYLSEQLNIDWENTIAKNPMHENVDTHKLETEWKQYKRNLQNAIKTNSELAQLVADYSPLELGYDSEHNWLIFRYVAKNGRIAGFTSRNLNFDKNNKSTYPKWKHSHKNNSNINSCHNLYHLYDGLKAANKRNKTIILVEGPKDCIPFLRTDRDNVIATSGVSNLDALETLSQINYFILSYDGDEAGRKGMRRMAQKLLSGMVSADNVAWIDWRDKNEELDPYDYYMKNQSIPTPKIIFSLFDDEGLKQLYGTSSAFNKEQIILYLAKIKDINYNQAKDFLSMGHNQTSDVQDVEQPIKYSERMAEMLGLS